MALIAIHHRRYSSHPSSALSRPYKSHPEDPQSTPHLTMLLPSPLPRRNASPLNFSDRHHVGPPHRRSCPGEPPTALRTPDSPSPAPWPAPVDTEAARGRNSGELGATVHGRSTVNRGSGGSWTRGHDPRVSFRKTIVRKSNFRHFAFRPLGFSKINRSPRIYSQTREFEK
jgi:hypothetical protein